MPKTETDAGTERRSLPVSKPFITIAPNGTTLSLDTGFVCPTPMINLTVSMAEIKNRFMLSINKKGSRSCLPLCLGSDHFFMYITSLTNFTVLGTSGRYCATRFGA